jgi:hypothetical protein
MEDGTPYDQYQVQIISVSILNALQKNVPPREWPKVHLLCRRITMGKVWASSNLQEHQSGNRRVKPTSQHPAIRSKTRTPLVSIEMLPKSRRQMLHCHRKQPVCGNEMSATLCRDGTNFGMNSALFGRQCSRWSIPLTFLSYS